MKYRYREPHEMKDSGVEWLGIIPREWEVKKIKYLSNIGRGASPRPIDDPKYFDENGEYAWTRIADVTSSGKYLLETAQKMSNLGASLSVKLEPGNLFISIAGSVGKPCITGIRACIHDGFIYFHNLNKKYYNLLYHIFMIGQCYAGLGKLGTQLNLNRETIGNIFIALPTDDSEQKIADFLDLKCSQFDSIIEKKESLITKLEEAKKSLISEVVTGKVKVIEKENGSYEIGKREPHEMKDSGVEWLGMIPREWEVSKLKYVFDLIQTGTTPSTSNEKNFLNGIINWFTPGDFKTDLLFNSYRKISDTALLEKEVKEFPGNSIVVVGIGATAGKVAFSEKKLTFNQQLTGFYSSKNCNKYYFYLLKHLGSEFLNLATFTTLPILNNEFFKKIDLLKLKITDQQKIADFLDLKCGEFDSTIEKQKELIEKLKKAKQSLISEAVTGKIEVL